MDLISVIVPIYKVEEYLDHCVQSIVDQTYTNLEIILVDDGSPDRCPQMCDDWAKKDSRIRVIHKKNGGLSDARNAGLDIAKGDYIAFVDSDDWIEREYIDFLYRSLREHNAQLSACDLRLVYSEEDAITQNAPSFSSSVYTPEQALATLQRGQIFRAIACNKLYARSLVETERFEVGKYHEDEFFTYRIIAKTSKLTYLDIPLYNYWQRAGSIMSTFSVKHLDVLDAYLQRLSLFAQQFPSLYAFDKMSFCVSCANFYIATNTLQKQERTAMQTKIKHCRKQVRYTANELRQHSAREIAYIVGTGYALKPFCWFIRKMRKE